MHLYIQIPKLITNIKNWKENYIQSSKLLFSILHQWIFNPKKTLPSQKWKMLTITHGLFGSSICSVKPQARPIRSVASEISLPSISSAAILRIVSAIFTLVLQYVTDKYVVSIWKAENKQPLEVGNLFFFWEWRREELHVY